MGSGSRNSGQSLVEFSILFPVIIYFTLILIQTALIYNAYQVVNYAAYCSARAGIVYEGSIEKMERAAGIATIPIACRKASSQTSLPVLPQIADIYECYQAASLKTEVELSEYTDSELTVTVTHHFQLIVPGVGISLVPILKIWDMPLYSEARKSTEEFGSPHLPVKATCTLPL